MRILARTSAVAVAGFVAGLLVFALPGGSSMAHGGGADAVVEVASAESGFVYGLALTWSDGDPITGAHLVMQASHGDLSESAEPVEVSPGVYVGNLPLVSAGEWLVSVLIHHPDSDGSIGFIQNVAPGEHDTWLVLVDTSNEERVGSVPESQTSILEAPAARTSTTGPASETANPAAKPAVTTTTTTTTQPTAAAQPSTQPSDVVVDIAADEKGPAFDIGIRVVHLAAIGLWLVPVFASLFGRQNRTLVVLGITGVVLTVATGTVLMLWGTPIRFPGLFNPNEIADLSYGSPYVVAFAVKMVAVLLAAFGTIRWAVRADRRAALVTLTGAILAAVAITAMSQYHLLTHF